MRFSHDRRGQSVVIGTVILFGFLILALASYQAFAVPAQNGEAEFDHSQDLQSDMQELRASLLDVRNAEQDPYQPPVRVSLGFRYESRLFAVNPPPPEGALTTRDRGPIAVRNATVVPAVSDRFENTEPLFDTPHETRLLTYRPNYNEYRNPPRTTFEHSLLYNRFEGANQTVTGQRTVDGDDRQLSLVAYTGDLDRRGLSTTLDPETLDGPTPVVPITSDGGPLRVELPTHSPTLWADLLAEEPNVAVVDTTVSSVTVELDGEWDLQMARVGYDGGSVTETPFSNVTHRPDERHQQFDVRWNGAAIGDEAGVEYFENEDLLRINSNAPDPIPASGTVTESGRPVDGASVDFATTDSAVASFNESVSVSTGGTFGTGITPGDAGNTTLFAAAGDDVDDIDVEVLEQLPEELYPDTVTENAGTITSFGNMQTEDGQVATMDGQGSTAFDITTQTEDVDPDTYDLELGVSDVNLQGSSGGITVTVRNEDGTELGSITLTEADSGTTVLVSLDPVEGPNPQQISVEYTASGQNDDLELDFQRLVTFG